MAVITAPLMIVLRGIVASSYLLVRSRDSPGEEGTIGVLNASMGFSASWDNGLWMDMAIHNSMLVGSSSCVPRRLGSVGR